MVERRTIEVQAEADLPVALAELHRSLAPGDSITVRFVGPVGTGRLGDIISGAGFNRIGPDQDVAEAADEPGMSGGAGRGVGIACGDDHCDERESGQWSGLRRLDTLADTVGPGMRLLACGLNPSLHAARSGVAYSGPGNRFWPAGEAAGLLGPDRDPFDALGRHRIGMTDLVKRATRRADELTAADYRNGVERLRRLVEWLQPGALCVVGLAGWRVAVNRKATPGVQPEDFGGRPVHLMPSTSGLNAGTRFDALVEHFVAAGALADGSGPDRG